MIPNGAYWHDNSSTKTTVATCLLCGSVATIIGADVKEMLWYCNRCNTENSMYKKGKETMNAGKELADLTRMVHELMKEKDKLLDLLEACNKTLQKSSDLLGQLSNENNELRKKLI